MFIEDETNSSTGGKMENQHRTEKGDYTNKIKKGIIIFFIDNHNLLDIELLEESGKLIVNRVQSKYFN